MGKNQRLNDQEAEIKKNQLSLTILGNALIVFSGLLLYQDYFYSFLGFRDFTVEWYESYKTFLWHMGQNFSPILLITVLFFFKNNFNKIFLIFPVIAYLIQTKWIISDVSDFEFELISYYLILLSFIILVISLGIWFLFRDLKRYKSVANISVNFIYDLQNEYLPNIMGWLKAPNIQASKYHTEKTYDIAENVLNDIDDNLK